MTMKLRPADLRNLADQIEEMSKLSVVVRTLILPGPEEAHEVYLDSSSGGYHVVGITSKVKPSGGSSAPSAIRALKHRPESYCSDPQCRCGGLAIRRD
jgi:hypothetical protein